MRLVSRQVPGHCSIISSRVNDLTPVVFESQVSYLVTKVQHSAAELSCGKGARIFCRMESMTRFQPACVVVSLLSLCAATAQSGNGKSAPTAVLNLLVVKDSNGKPVKNAEVVLHPVDEHGRQKTESLELKTHEDGKAGTSGIAYGKLRIQVIAHGFRTFGADYVVDQPNMDITIKLEKPAEQYSIYK